MSDRPIARRTRPPVSTRRTRPVRRASAGLSRVRAGAALTMLVCAAAVYGVGASSAFAYTKLQLDGATLTDPAAVEAALADIRGENLFGLQTASLRTRLETLPSVQVAHVDVRLPGTLAVTLEERTPILVWQIGQRRYLADADGTLFALLPAHPPSATAELPIVEDQRAESAGLHVGQTIDPVDLDAATRLASLHPVDVGSEASNLAVQVTDESGFVVRGRPLGWAAVFGFYTPSLRTTELIPEQVRLLRSLLIGREPLVDRIILASGTNGTYVPKPTPKPTPTPAKSNHAP